MTRPDAFAVECARLAEVYERDAQIWRTWKRTGTYAPSQWAKRAKECETVARALRCYARIVPTNLADEVTLVAARVMADFVEGPEAGHGIYADLMRARVRSAVLAYLLREGS